MRYWASSEGRAGKGAGAGGLEGYGSGGGGQGAGARARTGAGRIHNDVHNPYDAGEARVS